MTRRRGNVSWHDSHPCRAFPWVRKTLWWLNNHLAGCSSLDLWIYLDHATNHQESRSSVPKTRSAYHTAYQRIWPCIHFKTNMIVHGPFNIRSVSRHQAGDLQGRSCILHPGFYYLGFLEQVGLRVSRILDEWPWQYFSVADPKYSMRSCEPREHRTLISLRS